MIKTAAGAIVGTAPPGSAVPVAAQPRRFLRIRAVREMTGLPTSTIYAYVAGGKFPKQFRIGPRCAAWDEAEVDAWMKARIAERDKDAA